MTALPAHSADLVTDLRSAVDAALTDLLTARPDAQHRAYADLATALAGTAVQDSRLAEAIALIGAATEHAEFGEFAEARLLMVTGHRVLCALDTAVRIPPHRTAEHDLVRPVRVG